MQTFIDALKEYSLKEYGVEPYLVGVDRKVPKLLVLAKTAIDGIGGYAFLPDFSKDAPPVQDYSQRVADCVSDWQTVNNNTSKPLIPPAVVGWDASARGTPGHTLDEVVGKYPYTPIVVGSSPDNFSTMVQSTLNWTVRNVPEGQRYGIVTAWNELAECCALLPEVIDGQADFSYLRAMRSAIDSARRNPLANMQPMTSVAR